MVFTFDTNTGATRTGTLIVAGQTLTVTQAGATYVSANPFTKLVSEGLVYPDGVAVDSQGNVYFSDQGQNAIYQYRPANGTVETLVSTGLNSPYGVAVDGSDNVYIADWGNNAIKQWSATRKTLTTLVTNGLNKPTGVAVDGAGNVYIADNHNNLVKKLSLDGTINPLVSSGLHGPACVAVDAAGNVYFSDYWNSVIKKWSVVDGTVTILVASKRMAGDGERIDEGHIAYPETPEGVAVDGSGNVYFSDYTHSLVEKWSAATGRVTVVADGSVLGYPWGVAVDSVGNVYIGDPGKKAVAVVPQAYVDTAARFEPGTAGSDMLPVVLPAPQSLAGLFAPTSDDSWLTITGVTNGVVSFAFTANPARAKRTGHFTVLGQRIPITQSASVLPYVLATANRMEARASGADSVVLDVLLPTQTWTATANSPWLHLSSTNGSGTGSSTVVFTYDTNLGGARTGTLTIAGQTLTIEQSGSIVLGTTHRVEGPAAGADSVILADWRLDPAWTASADASWLHLDVTNSSGSGSANVVFTFDANPGAIRTGTLTIAGETLTITQAGSAYVAANSSTTLVSLAKSVGASGIAVDAAGNVYWSEYDDETGYTSEKQWSAASGKVKTFLQIYGKRFAVGIDGSTYIIGDNEIQKWTAPNGPVTDLVSGLGDYNSQTVVVDAVGNIYEAAGGEVNKWTLSDGKITTLVSTQKGEINGTPGIAVDVVGNVYIITYLLADGINKPLIKKWTAANKITTTLISSGLVNPDKIAVDSSGNLYIFEQQGGIKKWNAATGTLTSDFNAARHIAVDGVGNLYTVVHGEDGYDTAINEIPRAFVDPTARFEPASEGTDALPLVLPATENLAGVFAPASDQPWLTITGITNGVVNFAFTANATLAPRTGTLTVLGQNIAIHQAGVAAPTLNPPSILPGGGLQFSFSGTAGASYSVLFSTNVALPRSDWTVVGPAIVISPGAFQFTTPTLTAAQSGFYQVTSP